MREILLFAKAGCHLCDEARSELWRLAGTAGAHVREVDILGDEALFLRYRLRVPVVAVDGREVAEGPWTAAAERRIRRALARSARDAAGRQGPG